MFIGPWDQGGPWNPRGFDGVVRFLNRVRTLVTSPAALTEADTSDDAVRALRRATHQTLRKVTEDIERFAFNTMIAAEMEFVNTLMKLRESPVAGTEAWTEAIETLVLMLAPAAPHTAEELWERLGGPYSIHEQPWPDWDPDLAADEQVEVVVQVNG
jgi:leucyl-tRNA synthetase